MVNVSYNVFDSIANILKPDEKICELSAIWLDKNISLHNGEQVRRVVPGMILSLEDGQYRVQHCRGTISSSQLHLILQNLEDNTECVLNL